MTVSHNFDREIAAFLADGPSELPDRSFDAVRDEIERTRQRAPFGPWRVPLVSSSVRLLASATFVLVMLVGASLLAQRADLNVGGPTPTPCPNSLAGPSSEPSGIPGQVAAPSASGSSEPSAFVSASASPSAEPCPASSVASPTPPPIPDPTSPPPVPSPADSGSPLNGGDVLLSPGLYQLAPGFPVAATITVPADWLNCSLNPVEQSVCRQPENATGPASVGLAVVENVVASPCEDVGLDPPVGPTVDDLVAAIRGLNGFTSTDPVAISVDGHAAKEFTLTAPSESVCSLFTWSTASRTNGVSAGEINRLRIVDVGGTRILIGAAWHPGQEALLPEILGVLDSVRFPGSEPPSEPPSEPTAAPTPPPSQSHQVLDDPARVPGRAALTPGFPVAATINLPAGWGSCSNTVLEQAVCGPPIEDGTRELSLMYVDNVVADPCADVGLDPPIGPSVDDLVAAIRNLEGFTSTNPVDITVDGHPGTEFVVTAPTSPPCDGLFTWRNALRANGVGAEEKDLLRIVDVDGTRIVLAIAWQAGQAEPGPAVLSVLDSVQFP